MNTSVKHRALALLLALCMVFSLFCGLEVSAFAAVSNTGTRHALCTELSAQAEAYYSGEYDWDTMSQLSGVDTDSSLEAMDGALYAELQELMSDTMTRSVSYKSLTTYWPDTDCSANGGQIFIYSDAASNSSVSREHVWPKSRASFYQKNGGSDLHHLRPEDTTINSTRSNYTMGDVIGVLGSYSSKAYNGNTVLWYSSSADLVEVADNVKGDVARILLYVYVRWGQPNLCENVAGADLPAMDSDDSANDGLKVIEDLDTLLEWCAEDPVDTWEMSRNDCIESIQGNRNVFIDYPEYAWLIFGRETPEDMPTPSGNSGGDPVHQHSVTVVNAKAATCTESGYTGDKVCSACGETVEKGSVIPAAGHDYKSTVIPATCSHQGYTIYACACGDKYTSDYTPLAPHSIILIYVREPSCTSPGSTGDKVCSACGMTVEKGQSIPSLGHDYLDGVCTRCGQSEPVDPFSDISSSGYYEYIVEAANAGIISGYPDGTYRPNNIVTRAQFITMLYRSAGSPEAEDTELGFADADTIADSYKAAVAWGVKNGVISGYGDNTFRPDQNISRAQMATFIYRYMKDAAGYDFGDVPPCDFEDADEIAAPYVDAVNAVVSCGVMNGMSTTAFAPNNTANRGMAATVILRVYNLTT